jgi:hypothetical protein
MRLSGDQVPHPDRVVVAGGDHYRTPVSLCGRYRVHGAGVAGERCSDRLSGGLWGSRALSWRLSCGFRVPSRTRR